LEAYVGDPGLIRAAREEFERGHLSMQVETIDDLLHLAQTGDPSAIRIFKKAGSILGIGIANLINLFNPKKIIISGEGTREGDFLFTPMKESIQQNTMPGLFDPKIVEIVPWGDDAWARGAAGLVLRELFESPIHKKTPASVPV
jgi:predicted NBD/HSP70 family sugar kinase